MLSQPSLTLSMLPSSPDPPPSLGASSRSEGYGALNAHRSLCLLCRPPPTTAITNADIIIASSPTWHPCYLEAEAETEVETRSQP
ncbi:hypothetical protein ONZ51_g4059 [Trametes cubensis]|uniref:Uncharacterized protein n=1 Tax=Trametes cubensis TaxID=1111947 RepID=A0AAD7TWM1_9APHY|nr:hypothetical protein ONZ51_g4059 [Trametes cubensis]